LIILTTSSLQDHFSQTTLKEQKFFITKNPGITPREHLGLIVGNNYDVLMLKTPMLIQAYILNRVANQTGGTIQLLDATAPSSQK
jgi:hypothetical protein